MKSIYILAPRDRITGGIELLHQLGHVLNENGIRAYMLYHPFGSAGSIPDAYSRYNVAPITRSDLEPNSRVVIPEVYTKLAGDFSSFEQFYWWLSVDNFRSHAKATPLGRILRGTLASNLQLRKLRRTHATHLYQSEYARRFLESARLGPSRRLSDYIADDYVNSARSLEASKRENILVFNPSKGMERSQPIIDRLLLANTSHTVRAIPLQGMTRDEICDLLGRAKVYIDFGGHPGKDRIPREAASMGTCVIVNRRGSAANSVDVPIPDDFKIDDRVPGYESVAASKIIDIMENFQTNQALFDAYRRVIALERSNFSADGLSIFVQDQ